MKNLLWEWTSVFCLSALIVSLSMPIAGWSASAGNPKQGKARYRQYCAVCHGERGRGDGPMAKATTPPAPRLTSKNVRRMTDQELLAIIAEGKGGIMPAWRGILNDQELQDMVVYVRSLSR